MQGQRLGYSFSRAAQAVAGVGDGSP